MSGTCVVVGGGPAGMVLGLLLARAGIGVTVLEKHGDFLRDFRGDTVHPSTLTLLEDLGLFEAFDALPQTRLDGVGFPAPDGGSVRLVTLGRLRVPHPYIAMVPQWDLLDLLARAAGEEPTFALRMNTEAVDVLREGGRVTGVRYRSSQGAGELRADLVVACDGRGSVLRRAAGLPVREYPVPFDVCGSGCPPSGTRGPPCSPGSAPAPPSSPSRGGGTSRSRTWAGRAATPGCAAGASRHSAGNCTACCPRRPMSAP